jgi:putative membrane-bound dehydrogenase-like protein
MRSTAPLFGLVAACATLLGGGGLAEDAPRTGPETEKRFPPLRVPPGFKATLFACDPLVEYPSAIALGPRPGTLFVAADYMTGLGTEIVRRDELRLLEDTDGDGYADKVTVYAQGFNSIQGLAYHDGAVYVMHAPFLSVVRDTGGKAGERRDLLSGLGLPPEQNPVRLHCANGVVVGHDGWLYLALGDHGCDVRRPEGDRLVLKGGGILRCRTDGRDLHVFATGLRNIYDIALDEELNVFVRDNENDGGDYKIRVCHSFFAADHGYPYLYYEHPEEALPPLADLGLGSSAGGVCYLETGFPADYRGDLFFCEWGRAVVRYHPERAGSGFAPLKEIEFASGAENDPYGFKPTDLVVDRDGALFVADWADGQRPKRGRGRIYCVRHVGKKAEGSRPLPRPASLDQWIARLDSDSYYQRVEAQQAIEQQGSSGSAGLRALMGKGRVGLRGRLHAVWILAHVDGPAAVGNLLRLAETDPDPRFQAQAIRALADLTDPVLLRHRLDIGPGDADLAARLAALAEGRDPRVQLEAVIALGRLRWLAAPAWLRNVFRKPDAALAHAAQQTLRRSENWPAVLKLLDEPDPSPIRAVALRAVADQAVPVVVDGLIDRLRGERSPVRRREYADTLTRVHKRAGPQPYWGYRPPPRPPNSVAWERTRAIEEALDHALADPDRAVRLAVLRALQREKVPPRLDTLGRWLHEEHQAERVAAILESLREAGASGWNAEARRVVDDLLGKIVADKRHSTANRLAALAGGAWSASRLLDLASSTEDGPVLADILRRLAKLPASGLVPEAPVVPLLFRKVSSPDAEVRAAAVEALADLHAETAHDPVRKLLEDPDVRVRRAAAVAAGKLVVRPAIEPLLKLARDPDPAVRGASLEALRQLHEPRALPLALAALEDRATHAKALACVGELGGPDQVGALRGLALHDAAGETLSGVVRILAAWHTRKDLSATQRQAIDRAVAEVQGAQGVLLRWHATGPLRPEAADPILERYASPRPPSGDADGWRIVLAAGTEAPVNLGPRADAQPDAVWFGLTEVVVPEQTAVQFLAGGNGQMHVWLNGERVHKRDQARTLQADSDRFPATLRKGVNRLLVQLAHAQGTPAVQVRFRRQGSTAERERLMHLALTRAGDPDRGRKLFENADKSQCLKCHRIGDRGERIGPELTGLGSRFSRIYIVESILEPSRTIATGFQTIVVVLKDGRSLIGVKVAETDKALTLADNQGQKHVLPKADIEEQQPRAVSTMPDGLETRLTADEFVDLIAFLVSQKETRALIKNPKIHDVQTRRTDR